MVRSGRVPCVRYSCKLVAQDGQSRHIWDVELLPRGGAYVWILADLHTLACYCYSVVSPNKIPPKEVDCVFFNNLHRD